MMRHKHHHHHNSSTENTRCKNVSLTTGLEPGQLTVMLLIMLIISFCLSRAWVGFLYTLKVIQLAQQHLIRSASHREAADSFLEEVFKGNAWDPQSKPVKLWCVD